MSTPTYHRARARQLMAQGRCQKCGVVKDSKRALQTLCESCAQKDSARKAVFRGQNTLVLITAWEGMQPCKGCARMFWTPDRRSVRYCDPCRDKTAHIEETCDMAAALFDV